MTQDELDGYFLMPEHFRDRAAFRQRQLADARAVLANIPPVEWREELSQSA